jgi:hypothetical protein
MQMTSTRGPMGNPPARVSAAWLFYRIAVKGGLTGRRVGADGWQRVTTEGTEITEKKAKGF